MSLKKFLDFLVTAILGKKPLNLVEICVVSGRLWLISLVLCFFLRVRADLIDLWDYFDLRHALALWPEFLNENILIVKFLFFSFICFLIYVGTFLCLILEAVLDVTLDKVSALYIILLVFLLGVSFLFDMGRTDLYLSFTDVYIYFYDFYYAYFYEWTFDFIKINVILLLNDSYIFVKDTVYFLSLLFFIWVFLTAQGLLGLEFWYSFYKWKKKSK